MRHISAGWTTLIFPSTCRLPDFLAPAPRHSPIKTEVIGLGWEAHGVVGKNLNFWHRAEVYFVLNIKLHPVRNALSNYIDYVDRYEFDVDST